MYLKKWAGTLALAAAVFTGAFACRTADVLVAEQATVTPTRTPRPTRTPIPTATDTPVPTDTPTPEPTATSTRRPTVRPTPRPPTEVPAPVVVAPTTSPFEFHVNPPFPCEHSGLTYLKGTVYLDKNDPTNVYVGAIVALGPPDGSTIYDRQKTKTSVSMRSSCPNRATAPWGIMGSG